MSTVGPPSHLGCPVHLNVINDQVVGIETFVLGIGFRILQQVEQEFGRLHGPTALRSTMDLGLSVSTNTTHEPPERNDFLLGHDVFQVGCGPVEWHFLDGLSCLPCVLRKKADHHPVARRFADHSIGRLFTPLAHLSPSFFGVGENYVKNASRCVMAMFQLTLK